MWPISRRNSADRLFTHGTKVVENHNLSKLIKLNFTGRLSNHLKGRFPPKGAYVMAGGRQGGGT